MTAKKPVSTELQGSLAGTIRLIYLRRSTGVFEMHHGGQSRRLYFVEGELHLTDTHPLAQQVAKYLRSDIDFGSQELDVSAILKGEGARFAGSPRARRELRKLMGRVAAFLAQLKASDYRFQPEKGSAALPPNLVGPLPTADLVMELGVAGLSEAQLLERLGGEKGRWTVPGQEGPLSHHVWLETREAFLLSRLEQPMAVADVLRQMGGERGGVLVDLCRLQAVDLVVSASRAAREEPVQPGGVVTPRLLQRFRERVSEDLHARPLRLEPEMHKKRLAELLAGLGEMDHYQLLHVEPTASTEEIHQAFDGLARMVHPDHAGPLGLGKHEGALELLFERATEAYIVLGDPTRRGPYNLKMDINPWGEPDPILDRETRDRELARKHYEQALRHMAAEEYHYAHELLQEAVVRHQQPEYFALLGQVQAKNSNWLKLAVGSFRKALDLDPSNVPTQLSLARTCEEEGLKEEARLNYQDVLDRYPSDEKAREGLDRIEGRKPKEEGKGFFHWLFSGGKA